MIEWWEVTLVILGGVITVFTVWEKIESRARKIKEPTNNLEARIDLIEKKMEFEIASKFVEYDARFGRDKARLDSIEEGNKVILNSLLAIMKHDIDGNHIEALENASSELQNYLVHK